MNNKGFAMKQSMTQHEIERLIKVAFTAGSGGKRPEPHQIAAIILKFKQGEDASGMTPKFSMAARSRSPQYGKGSKT